jgi:murein DD-endopeptidase MepM/ murein hydrolase activator NlpD
MREGKARVPQEKAVGRRRVVHLLSAVVLTALLLAGAVHLPLAEPGVAHARTRSQLQRELEDKRSSLQKAREGIKQAEATKKAALGDIADLDKKIDALEQELERVERERDRAAAELAETRKELERLKAAIEQKRAQLAKAEEDLAAQQVRLNARAASIYKGGEIGYIEAILSTERLVDLVNRLDLLTMLMKQDEEVLSQIKRLKQKVTADKAALHEEENRLSEVETKQVTQTKALNALVAERAGKLDSLADARGAKQAVVKKAEQDKTSWEQQEDQLLNESNSIEAELRRLATAKPKTGSSSGSSSGGSGSGSGGGDAGTVTKGSGQMAWPLNARLSSPFGYRIHPIFKTRKMHTGIDLAAPSGTPIRAADGGTIVFAGWRGGYGKTVIVQHGNGLATLYAHLSSIKVGSGQSVGKGDVVGLVGSTGYSTGPHLHFEVRKNGSPVNPLSYL